MGIRTIGGIVPCRIKKRFLHNTLRLDSEEITFPLKHYETVFDLLTNVPRFFVPPINGNFIHIFSNYINKYQGQGRLLFNSCHGDYSILLNANLVSYFPSRVYTYKGTNDFAEKIMNPTNCHSSTVTLSTKEKFSFTQSEPV